MKTIVIAGTSVYGIGNMGDEALLAVLCRELHVNIDSLEITWMARHPSVELDKLYNIQKSIKNLEHDSKDASLGKWFRGLNPGDSPEDMKNIREAIEGCDLLIIGGDPFNEIAIGVYRGLMPHAALLITLAKFVGKPTMLYSIHMGRPLETAHGKELAKYCIENVTKITLREEFSKDVLKEMGVKTGNSVVLTDTAWGLNPYDSEAQGEALLKNEGIAINSDRPLIGINFRHQYWSWSGEDWKHYCAVLAEACDYLVEKTGADLLFIPNSTYEVDRKHTLYQDDRPTHQDIVAAMKHQDRTHQMVKQYNLYETLSVFPLLDMHFSNRRHSLVFAAIHGVPPVACGGNWHVKPAMDEIHLGDKFINIEDLSAESLKTNMGLTWDNRAEISKKILQEMPRLREGALGHAKVAAELIK